MPEIAENIDEERLLGEVLANFAALINDNAWLDHINEIMGIGRFQFLLRKQMRVEILGLRMALWRLALARSFPKQADSLFLQYLDRYISDHPDKISRQVVVRAQQYWGMLQPGGDSDFQNVAKHLTSFQEVEKGPSQKALTLKLALAIRRDYKYIFDRLI